MTNLEFQSLRVSNIAIIICKTKKLVKTFPSLFFVLHGDNNGILADYCLSQNHFFVDNFKKNAKLLNKQEGSIMRFFPTKVFLTKSCVPFLWSRIWNLDWFGQVGRFKIHKFLVHFITILITAKGQLISKCPFGVIVWTKIPTKKLTNSALESEKWLNQQNKGTFL